MDDFRPPVQQNKTPEPVPSPEGPETYKTSTGQPTELAPTPPPAPVKKKSNVGKWLLWGLVILLIAGLIALAYWQWAEASEAKKQVSSYETELTSAQDALHEKKPVVMEPVSGVGDTNAAVTDEDKIIVTAKAYSSVVVPHGAQNTVEIEKSNDSFVKVASKGSIDTVHFLMKKAENKEWVVIASYPVDETTVNTYKIPADFR